MDADTKHFVEKNVSYFQEGGWGRGRWIEQSNFSSKTRLTI